MLDQQITKHKATVNNVLIVLVLATWKVSLDPLELNLSLFPLSRPRRFFRSSKLVLLTV